MRITQRQRKYFSKTSRGGQMVSGVGHQTMGNFTSSKEKSRKLPPSLTVSLSGPTSTALNAAVEAGTRQRGTRTQFAGESPVKRVRYPRRSAQAAKEDWKAIGASVSLIEQDLKRGIYRCGSTMNEIVDAVKRHRYCMTAKLIW